MSRQTVLRVAIGVVVRDDDKVLLTQRPVEAHLGGLWEFPGGKIEAYETPLMALIRELREEVDIELTKAMPFMELKHHYSMKTVELSVFLVTDFQGRARCLENQLALQWTPVNKLHELNFPEANQAIVNRLQNEFLARLP